MKICPKCNTQHEKPGKFCSRACANSRGPRSASTKEKQSASAKLAYSKMDMEKFSLSVKQNHMFVGPYTKVRLMNCSHCKIQFWSHNLHTVNLTTTCSDECFLAVKRKNRAGSKTSYKGELYDSQWEVDLAMWLDENKIEYVRPKKHIPWVDSTGKSRKYFPDFYLPALDLYVDPKNKFCIKDQQEKLDYVQTKINLVYGEVNAIKEHIRYQF